MVKQIAIAGPISRKIGVRLHSEMGYTGEEIWARITGGEWVGWKRFPTWYDRAPPIDVIDHEHKIGYQIKVITDPTHRSAFSGAVRHTAGKTIGGRLQYVGTPAHKLEDIRAWLKGQDLEGYLIVMLLDEDANRATVYAKKGVHNATISEMIPIGVIDNDKGIFHVPILLAGGIAEAELPIPAHVEGLPRFPNIPKFLRSSTEGEIIAIIPGVPAMFRRPVHVRQYRRRK